MLTPNSRRLPTAATPERGRERRCRGRPRVLGVMGIDRINRIYKKGKKGEEKEKES
jgi:hypothetical protein